MEDVALAMAYKHWSIEDLPWDQLDPSKVDEDLLKIVKAAGLVEHNAEDYAHYLCNVFSNDEEFKAAAQAWAEEEVQHGEALGRWAQMLDPSYDYKAALERFKAGYRMPHLDAKESVRGSRSGEMIARCMVETGTSSFYTAVADSVEEPVLRRICLHIAADEHRHYKLFYDHLKKYLERENLGKMKRLKIALGRVAETEDDELAYAYFAANHANENYERKKFNQAYMRRAFGYYKRQHVDRGVAMMFKACGLSPQSAGCTLASRVAWWLMDRRARRLRAVAA